MDDADVEAVRAAYRAFADGDIDAAVAQLDPGVCWTEPASFPFGGRYEGPVAVADYLRRSRALWSELHSTPTIRRHGDRIVATHAVHGTMADGSTHDNVVVDVFTFRDGRVVDMTAYAGPADLPPELAPF